MTTVPSGAESESGAPESGTPSGGGGWRGDFAILSTASAVSQLGSMGVAAAGPLLALFLTRSPIAAGYVTAASVVPGLLLHVVAGVVVDRIDRRKVMLASQLVRIISALATCLCLLFLEDPVYFLIAAAFIDGSCAVFYEIAEIAAVPDLVGEESLNAAIGTNEAKLNASMFLGRPLGGMLLAINPVMPWLVDACTSFFPFMTLVVKKRLLSREGVAERMEGAPVGELARPPGPVATVAVGGAIRALRPAFALLVRDSFSRAVLAVCVLANFSFQVIVLLQILLAQREGLPAYVVGVLLSCSGLGGLLGAIGSSWLLRLTSPGASVVLCAVLWFPLVWVATRHHDPVIGLGAWGVCSVIGAYINVALRAHQAKAFPRELGRITGITRFLSVGAVALGALSGGWIIDSVGIPGTAFMIRTVFAAFAIVLIVLYFKEVCDLLVVLLGVLLRIFEFTAAWAGLAVVAFLASARRVGKGVGRIWRASVAWMAPARSDGGDSGSLPELESWPGSTVPIHQREDVGAVGAGGR
ncbi:MFS transporter [Actinomadura sp. LD22]|uniref:MFS transporter n=1 Tax=Actinomadura physcomitrii TaxID=2650748 RepID=A0A6I4M815_9ACTN|nr:MFS transporter [Actinomadura physcomitrii]MVZ98888.1 MFS transporter [Actinomadura physcomitrii]